MSSILDPPIPTKVAKMKARVCWQHPTLVAQRIDQTRLIIEDGQAADDGFSFLVIGDSGSGPHPDHHPQRHVAEQMVPHLEDCRFLLHTGDVVYQVGSREQYPDNFIKPYREWLVGGEQPDTIAYDQMLFRFPFLPVPGNHDYYNLPRLYSLLVQISKPLRKLLGIDLNPNVGWHGSGVGDTYARAFLDYLQGVPPHQLGAHLKAHYGPWDDHTQGLRYRPGVFTRLPNRYYTFRYGGIDFFGLDSSTFNDPALMAQRGGLDHRQWLVDQRRRVLEDRRLVEAAARPRNPRDAQAQEDLDDWQAKVEQYDEMLLDLDKQIHANPTAPVDTEQLLWLRDGLVASWQDPAARGRIVFFHHPPYVTEATKWNQGQTLVVRHHLRWVLDQVAAAVPTIPPHRPPVNLVINGHAHCFEHLKTLDTGHADSYLDWIVCGGSGLSLRRQRSGDPTLCEPASGPVAGKPPDAGRPVAESQLFLGRTGQKPDHRRPYSFLRVDVKGGQEPKFVLTPHVSECFRQGWKDYALDSIHV
ncbi:MAG: metallophosphoesterase [Leptolyngbya sp.]|nr:metallophosphoesterase [Leptolyngbya sp.]